MGYCENQNKIAIKITDEESSKHGLFDVWLGFFKQMMRQIQLPAQSVLSLMTISTGRLY